MNKNREVCQLVKFPLPIKNSLINTQRKAFGVLGILGKQVPK